MKKRDYAFDNLKVFLIICVVFGHMLILIPEDTSVLGQIKGCIYYLIYSFHMPAFFFISGYFASFSVKKVLRLLGYYVLFSSIYYLFETRILDNPMKFQLHTPYYVFWYLLTLAYYYCFFVLLKHIPVKMQASCLVGLIILSLSIGYFDNIEYKYSLSRTFVFLPYFTMGVFIGCDKEGLFKQLRDIKPYVPMILLLAFASTIICFFSDSFYSTMLWGVLPYSTGYGPDKRGIIMCIAFLWIVGLLGFFINYVNCNLRYITTIGRNTLSIYLLHGFIVNSIKECIEIHSILLLFLISIGIVLLFGYQPQKANVTNSSID